MEHQDWDDIVIKKTKSPKKETFQKHEKIIEPPKKLGISILQARQLKNVTQKELANVLRINVNFINRWELGKENPNNFQIAQIEKRLGVKLPRNKLTKSLTDLDNI